MQTSILDCKDDRSLKRLRDLARTAVDAIGLCRVALIPANERFGTELRAAGISLVGRDEGPDAVIAMVDIVDRQALDAIAAALAGIPCASCLVLVRQTPPTTAQPTLRVAVERSFIAHGFSKHPATTRRFGYEGLGDDASELWALFEPPRAARPALEATLKSERDLHADMLREAGERSDAHVVRYELAARFVRPFDTVLDAACGLGYGAHVLDTLAPTRSISGIDASATAIAYATECYGTDSVRFQTGYLPDALAPCAQASIDFVVSLETLEHVEHPEALLEAFARVLKPGGRVFVSVPNDWADASGRDPNPHHLHVYDWRKLHAQLSRHFIVERAWRLIASGCKTGPERQWTPRARLLEEVAIDTAADLDAEWWLALAMKSPLQTDEAHYVQQVHGHFSGATHLVDFEAHYANPWLVAAMVELPWRLHDKAALRSLAEQVMKISAPDSADFGAALAVQGYRLLEERADADALNRWLTTASSYTGNDEHTNPHVLRWKISLDFLRGRVLELSGANAAARLAYTSVLDADADHVTPTLGTKQVEAAWRLGRLAWIDTDTRGARECWTRGVRIGAERLSVDWTEFVGDWNAPFAAALNDAGEILDGAVRCALALRATVDPARPRSLIANGLADIERQSLRAAFNRATEELLETRQALRREASALTDAQRTATRIAELQDDLARVHAAHTMVEGLAHARQHEIDGLRSRLEHTHATHLASQELAHLRHQEIEELRRRLTQTQAAPDEAQTRGIVARNAEVDALQARLVDPQILEQLHHTLDNAQDALATLSRQHETIVHSWSWRLTLPLRKLAKFLRIDRGPR
jgi:2-polyprenyl-3-methyl-5-hydroxy-6-metoxy-1,4-benzoquinol methylase